MTHDQRMNRHVIAMRRACVRQGVRSVRHYRQIGDRRGLIESMMYLRGALASYRATVHVLIANI